MFRQIMVPVDLGHIDQLARSLDAAILIARQTGAEVVFVGVSSSAPSEVARTPQAFAARLESFARKFGEEHGITTQSKAYITHDPATDLDDTLLTATRDLGADLVVMASHVPNLGDYIWPSNGGTIAKRAGISVFIVR